MIEAIETEYNGCRFRSRLEARWAVVFDCLGLLWEYEPEAFELGDGVRYIPDFRIPELLAWVEVKPPLNVYYKDVTKFNLFRGQIASLPGPSLTAYMLWGEPRGFEIRTSPNEPNRSRQFVACPKCRMLIVSEVRPVPDGGDILFQSACPYCGLVCGSVTQFARQQVRLEAATNAASAIRFEALRPSLKPKYQHSCSCTARLVAVKRHESVAGQHGYSLTFEMLDGEREGEQATKRFGPFYDYHETKSGRMPKQKRVMLEFAYGLGLVSRSQRVNEDGDHEYHALCDDDGFESCLGRTCTILLNRFDEVVGIGSGVGLADSE